MNVAASTAKDTSILSLTTAVSSTDMKRIVLVPACLYNPECQAVLKDDWQEGVISFLYLDAQIGRIQQRLSAVICGTIVNICSRYLIIPV